MEIAENMPRDLMGSNQYGANLRGKLITIEGSDLHWISSIDYNGVGGITLNTVHL